MSDSRKYETAFLAVLGATVFLMRDSSGISYPGILYALAALLALNLAAEVSLRRWPQNSWLATAAVLANVVCATSILGLSGGAESRLWVLYLLPIHAACLLLPRSTSRLVIWASALLLSAYTLIHADFMGTALWFALIVKAGVLLVSGLAVAGAVHRERRSDRRAARLALAAARMRVERERHRMERFVMVSRLSGELAHSFNGHITTVLGACELAANALPANHAALTELEAICSSARACEVLIENIRAASRRALLRPCAVEAGNLVQQCRKTLQEAVGEKILVEVEAKGEARVYVDPAQFSNALKHLALRAKKAMDGRGILTLRMRGDKSAGWARIEIEDSGRPLSVEERAALVEPFSEAALRSFGSGLGLAAAHGIIRQSGGQLSLVDADGPTTFRIQLPAVCLLGGRA